MIASLEEVEAVQASGAPSPSDEYIACMLDAQMAPFFALIEASRVYLELAHEFRHIATEACTVSNQPTE